MMRLHHPRKMIPVWVCLFVLGFGVAAHGDDRPDLLSLVRAQHRAARESIRTLSADVTVELGDSTYQARAVVLTAGTFMKGLLHYGMDHAPGGRAGVLAGLRLAQTNGD